MSEALTLETFSKWASTALQRDAARAVAMWDNLKLSEDLLNHFLELPFRNKTHILTSLDIMVDPALLGVFYRSAITVHKLYPEEFNIEMMASSVPVDFFTSSTPSQEYAKARENMIAKLDSFDDAQKNISWRDKGLKISVFELMREIHGDELIVQIMKACLNLDTEVSMYAIAKTLESPEIYSEYPAEWILINL